MFEPESKDPVFRIFIKLFALVYMVGATIFLLHVKPVMELSAIFLCASLWILAAIHYFLGNWQSIDDTISVDNTDNKDHSVANIFIGFFCTLGSLVVYIAANIEIFFLVIVAGYIFYMATAYLWAYLLTKVIRYYIPH